MGKKYTHLTVEQRVGIAWLLARKVSKAEIAKQLKVHRSTIYREIKRNYDKKWGYYSLVADAKAARRQIHQKERKLDRNSALLDYVIDSLKLGWSPEQIVGRMKRIGGKALICHETIYAYIYSKAGIKLQLYKFLKRKRKKRYPKISRRKAPHIRNRVSISERPEYINNRSDFGHWECDLIMFKKPTKINLITLRERKSRYLIAIKNESKKSVETATNIISYMQQMFDSNVKSITFDNGFEFAEHELIKNKLGIETYFCDPYKSYQKDAIENANKILREFFPRNYPVDQLSQFSIEQATENINARPMKCLEYQTPYEAYRRNNDQDSV